MGIEECHCLFKDKISLFDFENKINEKPTIRSNFLRACHTYIDAIKCRGIDSSITNLLLCSSIECVSNDMPRIIIFKDWLIKNELKELEQHDSEELKEIMNRLYEKYLEFDEREGCAYNFKKFLENFCPEHLKKNDVFATRTPTGEDAVLEFSDIVSYIYSKFRSYFVHRCMGLIEESEEYTGFSLIDFHRNRLIIVATSAYINWFKEVVKESLFNYLMS